MSELDDWDYDLPDEAVARYPTERRDGSRLMCLARSGGAPTHHAFAALLDMLRPGDLLVGNNTRVLAARLFARRPTGGRVELLVLDPGPGAVRVLARPARKLRHGDVLQVEGGAVATVEREGDALRVRFDASVPVVLERCGHMPLPPYLGREDEASDRERYQTVYAGPLGAAAAPTAGLHFTEPMLGALATRGVGFETVTLHVGIGTFRPLRDEDLERGSLHEEAYEVPQAAADAVRRTRERGGRVIAIGTTSARTLESANEGGVLRVGSDSTRLFIRPGYRFGVVDGLITNFHLPRSSLLMLVAALTSRERLLGAYADAVGEGYRFYSYGDAMLIL